MAITPEITAKDLYKQCVDRMQHPIEHFQKEILKIRTSRANPSMIENIMVESYGNLMPLKDLALITAPEVRLLVVQPWDGSTAGAIDKAISSAGLGLNPAVDGNIIRIQLPQIANDQRDQLVKVLHKYLEECRIGIRNVRKDVQNEIRDAEKNKVVSEDLAKRLLDQLQKATDDTISKAEEFSKKKEDDIRA